MKRALLKGAAVFILVFCAAYQISYAFDLPWSDAAKQKRLQKQQEEETEPMVQTVEEWLERATDIRMEHRIAEPYKKTPNPNLVEKLDLPTHFEKYNNVPGSRELNLEKLKADKNVRSGGVISPNFKLMAYTECYYHPSSQQTTSAFFILPLDTIKGKKQRVLEANVFAGARKTPLIESTNEQLSQFLFSSLTIVDWSKDNKKVLLKEKTGSSVNGIYETNIWVYFLQNDFSDDDMDENEYFEGAYSRKFDNLNAVIKDYWFKKDRLNLNHYRWDIKPLGFYAKDENIIINVAYTYNEKLKEHIFLGLWGVNILNGEIKLLSKTPNTNYEISTNGMVLVKKLP